MARVETPGLRAVLWDLDGTLADSKDYHWLAWKRVMGADGRVLTKEAFLASFGQRNDSILAEWLGADADPSRIRRLGEAKEALYRELIRRGGITPLPGASEWVEALHKEGWRQAIASSAPRKNVEVMQKALGFEGILDTLVGAEDVTKGKPDPQVFLTAARRLQVPPARCVVVEDAATGIEAARRGGMACIGVGPGAAEGADLAVESLTDLPEDAFRRLLQER